MTSVDVRTPWLLHLSENPFGPLPSVVEALDHATRIANMYPEFYPGRLEQLIAEHEGLDHDQVVAGMGATGVALHALQAVTTEGHRIVHATPTFDGYPILAKMCGLGSTACPLDDVGRQDLQAMREAIDGRTSVVVVCNPHNPTGTLLAADRIESFVRDVPASVTVIVDEAYVEFVPADLRVDSSHLIANHPNVVVLRTFSKAYGLAGLRIGYALAAAGLAARLRHRQVPFAVNSLAVAAVRASYAADVELRRRISSIVAEREWLRSALLERGFRVFDSHGNFVYIAGTQIGETLERAGIRSRRYPNGDARITVGDQRAGRAVLDALTR